jgi:hypothetical protein
VGEDCTNCHGPFYPGVRNWLSSAVVALEREAVDSGEALVWLPEFTFCPPRRHVEWLSCSRCVVGPDVHTCARPQAAAVRRGTAKLSMTRSTIACRLIAFESARRTRTSLSGFLSSTLPPLSVTNGHLSRALSTCKWMIRFETVVNIFRLELVSSFTKSGVGMLSMMSTLPANKLAMRDGSLTIGGSIIS